ncbi:MAG: hypothetical protein WBD20_18575 [Pirellulaceae bacterium]
MSRLSHQPRKGGAFIILVVALLVVVLGATQAMLRGEVGSQRNEQTRTKTDALERALAAAELLDHDWQSELRFPIDQTQAVLIKANDPQTQLTASWISRETVQASITRAVERSSDNENDSKKSNPKSGK